jgi:hypothetical protein
MSDTPRTDALLTFENLPDEDHLVIRELATHARTLERELAAATEAAKALIDEFYNGSFTSSDRAFLIGALRDALAKNVIPTGTNDECPACFGKWSDHAEKCPNRQFTTNPEASPEISTPSREAFMAWLEGYAPSVHAQVTREGIKHRDAFEWEPIFLAGWQAHWMTVCEYQRSTSSGWVPVAERLPTPFETVAVAIGRPNAHRAAGFVNDTGGWFINGGVACAPGYVHHWFQIPTPPRPPKETHRT